VDVFDLAAQTIAGRDGVAAALSLLAHRDDLIRAAHAAGFSKMEIFRITGISRSTIDRILTCSPSPASPCA
jgi:hypothetical protein